MTAGAWLRNGSAARVGQHARTPCATSPCSPPQVTPWVCTVATRGPYLRDWGTETEVTVSDEPEPTSTISDNFPTTTLPAEFGRLRMLAGEDPTIFAQFRARVLAHFKPRDVFEEILVDQFIYHEWEARRRRRDKTNLLHLSTQRSAAAVASAAESGIAAGDVLVLGVAEGVMCGALAETLERKLDVLERINVLLEKDEAQRTSAMREIQRHREAVAEQGRRPVQRIEDAEFRTLDEDGGDKRLKSYDVRG